MQIFPKIFLILDVNVDFNRFARIYKSKEFTASMVYEHVNLFMLHLHECYTDPRGYISVPEKRNVIFHVKSRLD